VRDIDAFETLAGDLANRIEPGYVLYFEGDLGTGKTTLIQRICQALSVEDVVLSPTFSVLKTYTTASQLELLHVDLYRINDPAELLLMGVGDFLDTPSVWLIEWPEHGAHVIPPADIRVQLALQGAGRRVNVMFVNANDEVGA